MPDERSSEERLWISNGCARLDLQRVPEGRVQRGEAADHLDAEAGRAADHLGGTDSLDVDDADILDSDAARLKSRKRSSITALDGRLVSTLSCGRR